MATIKLSETKSGKRFWKVSVSRGHGRSPYTMRWYWPDGWSKRSAERELRKVVAEFERACSAGEIETRAERKAREAREAAERAKLKTVRQYGEGVFMPSKEATFSENARASYRMFLDRHIYPVLGDTLMVEVTPAMIKKLLLDFQKKGYAHATVVKLYNILNGLFDMAFLDDAIPLNPLLKVKRPAPRKDERADGEKQALTVEQLRKVLFCVQQEPLKWKAFISLMADTGARRGEVCGLQWADVDFTAGAVEIRRNLQYTPKAGVFVTTPKNGRSRSVDVGPDVLDLLRRLRGDQAESCISKWVFTQDGTPDPMHPQSPTRYFKRFGKKYGIDGFHPHLLRHTSASVALTHGADVVSVSERLGHADTAVTLRMYAHANEESIRRAGQTVRDALRAKGE